MEVWRKTSKAQADAKALKPMEPSEGEIHFSISVPYGQLSIDNISVVLLTYQTCLPLSLPALSTQTFPYCLHSALASILRAWLDQCPEDFQEPPNYPCLHRLMDYLRKAVPGSEALRRAEGLLEQLQSQASMEDTDGN